jgi:hypothetical protein
MAPVNRIPHTEGKQYREIRSDIGVVFPISLKSKMLLTLGTLLISMLAAPAVYVRRDSIRAIEGTGALPETLSLWAGFVILLGNLNTFFVGVYMLKYVRERADGTSLSREKITKQLRIEDFVMWFQVWGRWRFSRRWCCWLSGQSSPADPNNCTTRESPSTDRSSR